MKYIIDIGQFSLNFDEAFSSLSFPGYNTVYYYRFKLIKTRKLWKTCELIEIMKVCYFKKDHPIFCKTYIVTCVLAMDHLTHVCPRMEDSWPGNREDKKSWVTPAPFLVDSVFKKKIEFLGIVIIIISFYFAKCHFRINSCWSWYSCAYENGDQKNACNFIKIQNAYSIDYIPTFEYQNTLIKQKDWSKTLQYIGNSINFKEIS